MKSSCPTGYLLLKTTLQNSMFILAGKNVVLMFILMNTMLFHVRFLIVAVIY